MFCKPSSGVKAEKILLKTCSIANPVYKPLREWLTPFSMRRPNRKVLLSKKFMQLKRIIQGLSGDMLMKFKRKK